MKKITFPEKSVVEDIVEEKLSAIVAQIEAIIKPFQNDLKVEIDKANGSVASIRITATIKPAR